MKRIELKGRKSSKHLITLLTALTLILLGAVNQAHAQWATNGNNISNTNTGNVGIGTSTPNGKLDVYGGRIIVQPASTGSFMLINDPTWGNAGLFETTASGDIHLKAYSSGFASPQLFLKNGGNVGIGTTNPGSRLDVSGSTLIQRLTNTDATTYGLLGFFEGSTEKSHIGIIGSASNGYVGGPNAFQVWNFVNAPIVFGTNSAERVRIDGSGNVGIGTTTPSNPLTIARSGSSPYTNRPASELLQLVDKTDNTPQILFGSAYNGMWLRYTGTGGTAANQRLGVVTGAAGEAFVINNDGNVGIGTTNPQKPLDVVGDISATGTITGGNIIAKYQDVAEWVQSSRVITASTVVVLDTQKSNQVLPSTQAYDTRVAGVVSERPGLALGEAGKDKVLVATTGRVKVKVDATRAPIHVGDLLVTSDMEGVAMKSEPVDLGGVKLHRPGTLIGKALENLEKGTGEILVLLSLQ